MYHPFSIAETIKTSWGILKSNFVTIVVYSAIIFLILSVMGFLGEFVIAAVDSFWAQSLLSVVVLIVQGYTTLGLYKLIFTLIDSEFYEFEFKQIIPTIRMVFNYIIVIFLLAVVLITYLKVLDYCFADYPIGVYVGRTIGLLVGLYLAFRWMFYISFIVDEDCGPIESLNSSFRLSDNNLWKIVGLMLIILLFIAIPVQIAQFFPAATLAIIITYPFVNIILIVAYRKLIYSHLDVDDDVTETI
ncbi:hypothetical protein [Mucilaginibacter agri]|uniref:Glycerophosphoryl diester phosphodiesterase membrane domain-containing protein n=1 Tax=Mucilaginibacter agri TaxID=2695265 RepID=A0A965ZHB3_9SPHI|nr:hypothetical protein [Mucilaginibacter agri]NCD70092.1 hypothetical protein [Mucilaginibacter agri]